MSKPFKLALLTGRYQSLQMAHIGNIVLASQMAEEVLVFVGSAQLSGTKRNPFDIEFRIQALTDAINELGLDNVKIIGLKDLTHETDICFEWGKWVLDHVFMYKGRKPDLIIHGDDGRPNDPVLWFNEEDKVGIHFLMVPRNEESVSGTRQRELLLLNNYNAWANDTPLVLHRHFTYMRGALLDIPYYADLYKSIVGVESK